MDLVRRDVVMSKAMKPFVPLRGGEGTHLCQRGLDLGEAFDRSGEGEMPQ